MKISKLFHWLYASVMLLPLFAIGVTCFYTIFNKNAKDSYYGENINESTSEVVGVDNANKNTLYTIYTNEIVQPISLGYQSVFYARDIKINGLIYTGYNLLSFVREDTGSQRYIFSVRGDGLTTQYFNFGTNNYVVDFYFEDLVRSDFYIPFNYLQYNKDSYLDNSFYYATRLLKESNYFNWAKDSFLAQPITYITGLFGMDNDNTVIYLLSYWLDISIIWLTFDLVMYVPLLVHRWLDKGVLE